MSLNPRKIQNNPAKFVRKIAVHSPSGAGKSQLAGTVQDVKVLADIYHLDLDAGTATLQSRDDIIGEEARRAVDVERVLWSFLNREPDTLRYKALVVDGLSALTKREFQAMTSDINKEATYKEWGKLSSLSMKLIHLIRDLPLLTIINTWSVQFQAKLEGTDTVDPNAPIEIRPDVPKGAYNLFMGSCDDVFYLAAAEDRSRYLYTDKTKKGSTVIEAKMRDEAVAKQFVTESDGKSYPIIKNPTWPDLFARYQKAFAK